VAERQQLGKSGDSVCVGDAVRNAVREYVRRRLHKAMEGAEREVDVAGTRDPQARESRAARGGPLGMESGMGLETAQRTRNQSFLDSFGSARPKVLVIGCGGAGGNSVHRLHRMGIHGARTVVVNTDAVHLDSIQADRK